MKWNRTTVKAVVITFVTIIATSFFIKWTFDHDGETITLGGDDPTRSAAADPGVVAHGGERGHRPGERAAVGPGGRSCRSRARPRSR